MERKIEGLVAVKRYTTGFYRVGYSGFPSTPNAKYDVFLKEKFHEVKTEGTEALKNDTFVDMAETHLSSDGVIEELKFCNNYEADQAKDILRKLKPVGVGQNNTDIALYFSQEDENSRKYCRVPIVVNTETNANIAKEIKKIIENDSTEQMDFIFPYIHSGHMRFIYVRAKNDTAGKKIEKATMRDPSGYFAQCLVLHEDIVKSKIDTSDTKSIIPITADGTPYLYKMYPNETTVNLGKVLEDFKYNNFIPTYEEISSILKGKSSNSLFGDKDFFLTALYIPGNSRK